RRRHDVPRQGTRARSRYHIRPLIFEGISPHGGLSNSFNAILDASHLPRSSAMDLTFYYSPMSTATVTHVVLEELGVPYKKINVDIRKGEARTPEFLRINPNAKVPVVTHNGTPIWESAAITMYLGETFGVDKGL